MAQVVKCLPSKCEILSSNSSTTKKCISEFSLHIKIFILNYSILPLSYFSYFILHFKIYL
jgi:hypothetical protein